ncbi:hypothetical protein WK03_38555 [Burkholderia cepacia]|uniref:PhzF family phenazine biosynthesis protein n=1 Tax=Burkholderia cepacia TaxID=292 RepID=UPI0007538F03|nr:PhzF family phenazine biosynthesis protein [Burkholderia cepacia]KVQ34473.1 hypothetical protein WK03_38555 [Burkholderia cepacia]
MNSPARLFVVDVFTEKAFAGNPVAIVIPDAMPSATRMQDIARWIGFPETTFVAPAARDERAAYSVRIWSPQRELPFAGHPSIGTAHLLLEHARIDVSRGRFIQECPAGLIGMRTEEIVGGKRRVWFATPPVTVRPLCDDDAAAILAALGPVVDSSRVFMVDAGAKWLVLELPDASDVDRLEPVHNELDSLSRLHGAIGVTVFGKTRFDDAIDYEVRSFAPSIGAPEDAACGGGNACAAALRAWLNKWRPSAATHVASQGKHLQRSARIFWKGPDAAQHVEVGGSAVIVSEGSFRL